MQDNEILAKGHDALFVRPSRVLALGRAFFVKPGLRFFQIGAGAF